MKLIKLPCNDDDICDLEIGDIFYISGMIVTGRDEVYRRVTEENITPPADLHGMAVYHAGPIVKNGLNAGEWELVSIGPTTSARMEKWAADFIRKTSVKIMIGKGGMGEKTTAACRERKAVHCVYPGGCAVLGASQIEKIDACFWPEMGMAECMWRMKTHKFGPLIVSIDTRGNNLFAENYSFFSERKTLAMAE